MSLHIHYMDYLQLGITEREKHLGILVTSKTIHSSQYQAVAAKAVLG